MRRATVIHGGDGIVISFSEGNWGAGHLNYAFPGCWSEIERERADDRERERNDMIESEPDTFELGMHN